MTQIAAKIGITRHPSVLTWALLADRLIYLLCETLGRTTNPVVIVAMIAVALLGRFRHGERQFVFPPHID
jgi:ABC-type Fe3+-siderophore transport system permease subunit